MGRTGSDCVWRVSGLHLPDALWQQLGKIGADDRADAAIDRGGPDCVGRCRRRAAVSGLALYPLSPVHIVSRQYRRHHAGISHAAKLQAHDGSGDAQPARRRRAASAWIDLSAAPPVHRGDRALRTGRPNRQDGCGLALPGEMGSAPGLTPTPFSIATSVVIGLNTALAAITMNGKLRKAVVRQFSARLKEELPQFIRTPAPAVADGSVVYWGELKKDR